LTQAGVLIPIFSIRGKGRRGRGGADFSQEKKKEQEGKKESFGMESDFECLLYKVRYGSIADALFLDRERAVNLDGGTE
jgi:hypothetical protein